MWFYRRRCGNHVDIIRTWRTLGRGTLAPVSGPNPKRLFHKGGRIWMDKKVGLFITHGYPTEHMTLGLSSVTWPRLPPDLCVRLQISVFILLIQSSPSSAFPSTTCLAHFPVQRVILTLWICSGEQYQALRQRLHHIEVGRQHRVHSGYMDGKLTVHVKGLGLFPNV